MPMLVDESSHQLAQNMYFMVAWSNFSCLLPKLHKLGSRIEIMYTKKISHHQWQMFNGGHSSCVAVPQRESDMHVNVARSMDVAFPTNGALDVPDGRFRKLYLKPNSMSMGLYHSLNS